MRRTLTAIAALTVLFGHAALGQEAAAPAPIAFRPVVERAIDAVILPGYRRLAERAAEEATAVNDLCWQADAERIAGARRGFSTLVLAWSGIELIRFGPVRDGNRYERLFFWPDPRGRGLKQVQAILAKEDASATAVESLREKSVAVQGLFALEYVLYGTGSEALTDSGDPRRSFRCRFGAAIAGAIAATAAEIVADWEKPAGYADLMRDAGPDNPIYRSHGEAAQELIRAAGEQLQLARDLKIAHAIEATPDKAEPRRAPFWRSDLTLSSIRANIAAALALAGPEGIGAALPQDKVWIGNELAFELGEADEVLDRAAGLGHWEAVVADPRGHEDLTYVLIPLADAIALLEGGYPDALGLITGFNSLDGD
jgi:predicted lipoprotein